jgi:alpha-glucosidase (family GH31 glycosyl hydrolase)
MEWSAEVTQQMDYWITAGNTPRVLEHAFARVVGTAPMMPEFGLGFWQSRLRYWNQEQLLETAREYRRRGLPLDVIACDFFNWRHMGDFRFEEEFFPDPAAMVRELKDMGTELMVSVWPQISLRSENYVGDFLSNKECTIIDSNGKEKRVKNKGFVDQILIEGHHPAIVSHELFDIVQELIKHGTIGGGRSVFSAEEKYLMEKGQKIAEKEVKLWEAQR